MGSVVGDQVCCEVCGRVEIRGMYCSGCLSPRVAPLVVTGPTTEPESTTYQRCSRCGTDEAAGSYCTWCRGAEYELIDHAHLFASPNCPLGPYLNPSGRPDKHQIKQWQDGLAIWQASPKARRIEKHILARRTHPQAAPERPRASHLRRKVREWASTPVV